MKCRIPKGSLILIVCLTIALTNGTGAQTITDLFNTGVSNIGAILPLGVQDPHYINAADSTAPFTYYIGVYASNPTSNWISPTASGGDGSSYTVKYRTTFTLPINALLSSVTIAGFWGIDNDGLDILINGNSTGITLSGSDTFHFFHPFTLPSTFYKAGQNTLDFQWINNEGAGAFNVYFATMSYTTTEAQVSGTLKMEDIAGYADNQNITFVFRPVNGGSALTQIASVPPSGNFSIMGIPFTNYTLHIKGDKYLAANVSVDATNGNVSGVTAFLSAGDADNNNVVDIGDFGILVGAYGSKASDPTSGYDARADLNSDGKIDIGDFGLLVANYGLSGDN